MARSMHRGLCSPSSPFPMQPGFHVACKHHLRDHTARLAEETRAVIGKSRRVRTENSMIRGFLLASPGRAAHR